MLTCKYYYSLPELFSVIMNGTYKRIKSVSNAVLMSCRTKFIFYVQLWHGGSTALETIHELSSTLPCSTASPVVLDDFSMAWFQTACYCRAELNIDSNKSGETGFLCICNVAGSKSSCKNTM